MQIGPLAYVTIAAFLYSSNPVFANLVAPNKSHTAFFAPRFAPDESYILTPGLLF